MQADPKPEVTVVASNKATLFDCASEAAEAILSHDSGIEDCFQYEVRMKFDGIEMKGYFVTVIDIDDNRIGALFVEGYNQ